MSLLTLTIIGFFIKIGGIDNLWVSSIARGEGQHAEKTMAKRIASTFLVIYTLFPIATILLSSIFLFKQKNNKPLVWLSYLALFLASIPYMHSLSRAAGVAFCFIGFVGIAVNGRKFAFKFLILILITFFLGQVGLSARGNHYPGIKSYFSGMYEYFQSDESHETYVYTRDYSYAELNSLDQVPVATQLFEYREENPQSILNAILGFITQLNPLPANFVPLKPFGLSSLSEKLGTTGSVGITAPVLGQTYSAMGYLGCIIWIGVGYLLSWIQAKHSKFDSPLTLLAILFAIAGLVTGLHSQLRAMLRPIDISILLCILVSYRFVFNYKR